ncbi:MAG: hypothetical protein AB7E55_27445, partial [Pigmentiphaga sp.]
LTGLATVVDFGSRIVTWIGEQFSSVDWTGLGTTLVDGLLAGLSSVADFGERAAGWIGEQFSSVDWAGVGETLQAGLGSAISSGTAIAEGLANQVQNYDWSSLGESISGGLSGIGDSLGGMFDFSGIQSSIEELRPVLDPFIAILRDNLGETLANLSEAVSGMAPLWAALRDLFAELRPVLEPVAAIIGGVLLAAVAGIVLGISELAVILSKVLVVAIDVATAQIKSLTGVIETISAIVGGVVSIVKNLIEGDFSGAWEAAKEMVSGVVAGIETFLSGMPALAVEYIGGFVTSALGFLGDLVSDGAAKAGEVVSGVAGALGDLMVGALGHVSGFVHSALGFLADLVSDGASKAGEFLSGIMDALLDLFVDGPLEIYNFVQAGLTELGKLITEGAKKAGELPGAVLEAIGDLSQTLITAGEQVVQGFIDGMGNLLEDVKSKAGEIVGGVTGTITSGFGIFSPSRVMHQFGRYIDEGLIEGIQAGAGDVFEAVSELGGGMRSLFEQYIGEVVRSGDPLNDYLQQLPEEWRESAQAIAEYIEIVIAEGDHLNDWLTHLPEEHREALQEMGESWHEELVEAAQAAREEVLSVYEGLLNDLEGLASGDTAARLEEELAELLNLQRIAEQAGEMDLAAKFAEQAEAKADELRMAGELMATPIVEGLAETLDAERVAEEWDQRLSDALSGPAFGEGIAESISGLQDKIDLGPLMGVPQSVIDGWEAEKDELEQQAANYWWDVANAAAAGLIDPALLKEYADAGGEQFDAYLEALVGPEAKKELLGETAKMSKEAVDELTKVFAEAPELAEEFIDDIVKGLEDGSINVEDAMALLAEIPKDQLIPALEEMSETYQKLIVQAIIDGNWDLVASLTEVKDTIDEVKDSMDAGADSAQSYTDKMNQNMGGGLPSGGSSGGSSATDHPGYAKARAAAEAARDSGNLTNHGDMTDAEFDAYLEENRRRGQEKASKDYLDANPRNITVQNNVTVNVDGEPVAESVNKVNERDLAVNMGPI